MAHITETPNSKQAINLKPQSLLVISGTLIGMNFPLGKVALNAGVPPLLWAGLVSFGVLFILLPVNLFQGRLKRPSRAVLKYTLLSAPISFVVPNLLIYSVMPHLGAGYVGLMFALSPVFTLCFATCLGMKTPGKLGLLGIGVGLLGAATISISQTTSPNAPDLISLALAVGIPLALATGNITRSLYWPEGEAPSFLALWGHTLASAIYFLILMLLYQRIPLEFVEPVSHIAVIQMLISGITFPFVYRLQKYGGPVLLSQMGYVAAAIGLVSATLFLGERYPTTTWLGAGIIATGIYLTVKAQTQSSR
tara:strand:- start:577 stop:1500 length:924 start_codon:yes stop_codon:yes gene_type:complete